MEPQVVLSEKMMGVSIMGLIVNILGLVFFHEHAHLHGGGDEDCQHHHADKKKESKIGGFKPFNL